MTAEEYMRMVGYDGGYAKDLGDGTYAIAYPLLFHWTVITGDLDDLIGPSDKWCFATKELALKALADWPLNPPADYEPEGWHRHPRTDRRR